jgi:MoxR-like ATPase
MRGGLFSRLKGFFDGGGPGPRDVVEPYLLEPPMLPIPPLRDPWETGFFQGHGRFVLKREAGLAEQVAKERDFDAWLPGGFAEVEFKGAKPRWTFKPLEQPDGLKVEVLESEGGEVRQAAVVHDGLFVLDSQGAMVHFRRGGGKVFSVNPGNRGISDFTALPGGSRLLVVKADLLAEWDLLNGTEAALRSDHLRVRDAKWMRSGRFAAGGGWAQVRDGEDLITWGVESRVVRRRRDALAFDKERPGPLAASGDRFFLERAGGSSRVWRMEVLPESLPSREPLPVLELGTLPFEVRAAASSGRESAVYLAAPQGIILWDLEQGKYRLFSIPGLEAAAGSGPIGMSVTSDEGGRDVLAVFAGPRVFRVEGMGVESRGAVEACENREWSEKNPMFIRGGALRIGEFSFPLAEREGRRGLGARILSLFRRRGTRPEGLGISEREWKALNLPTNKRLIYDTLKGFAMGQHVLFIGETGGGKTWLAERIARLTGNSLWMASLTEFTRPKDLIARETFGEDGRRGTGLSLSTVLTWMRRKGVLLLDEIHKPLDGVSVVNNILQNGVYRLADGRVFRRDKERSWVIGTMNPVKPPYNGEPPSGELLSRFGLTLEVKYLPPDEEEALLKIFHEGLPEGLAGKLVALARELRKEYPDSLPLPLSSRTLLNVAAHVERFPEDDPAEAFLTAYNPASITDDPGMRETLLKAVERLGPGGAGPKVP